MPLPHIRASLPFQVSELIPMAVEDALLDYYPTGEREGVTGRMVQGMLVAATRDTVRANLWPSSPRACARAWWTSTRSRCCAR